MHLVLDDQQWQGLSGGQFTGPDGTRYRRRSTRRKRSDGDKLVAAGVPLVLYYWAGGQVDWFDGDAAVAQWQLVRRHVVSQLQQERGTLKWTAGEWNDGDERKVLVLTGFC
jgi:hypothetical protein